MTVVTAAGTQATNLLEGAEIPSILTRGPCTRKSRKSEETKGGPPKTAFSGRGTSPPKPTPEVGEERVRSPQARMRKIPPSSTGVRLLDPLRSCLAGSGKRDQQIGVSVGAALEGLEDVVERDEKFEPMLDLRIVVSHFAGAFKRLVIRKDGNSVPQR